MAVSDKDIYLKIGRPHSACLHCGAALSFAGKHPSMILAESDSAERPAMSEEGIPVREDYCAECWEKLSGERNYSGYWLARREPPKPRAIETRKERNAATLAWFEELSLAPDDPGAREAIYFAAHLLMKYGLFKWQRSETDESGETRIVFRMTGSGDELTITGCELSDEQCMEIKQQMDLFLKQYQGAEPEAAAAVAEK